MKKLFLLFLSLSFSFLNAYPQQSYIRTRIEKVIDDNLVWIKLTITNQGIRPIIINDMCKLSAQGRELGRSPSYVAAVAYDCNGRQIGNSAKLNFISFNSNNGINLKKGESEVQVFLLKSEDIAGFYPASFGLKEVCNLQLKVFLNYITFVPNGFLKSKEELTTNMLRF